MDKKILTDLHHCEILGNRGKKTHKFTERKTSFLQNINYQNDIRLLKIKPGS